MPASTAYGLNGFPLPPISPSCCITARPQRQTEPPDFADCGSSSAYAKGKSVMEATSQQALKGSDKQERDQLVALLQRVNTNLNRVASDTQD